MSEICFCWNDVETYVVNALRRIIISDMDTVAVSNSPQGSCILENNGPLHNEFIAQRIAMIPLAISPSQLAHQKIELGLDASGKGNVTSNAIQFKKTSSLYPAFDPPDLSKMDMVSKCMSTPKIIDAMKDLYGISCQLSSHILITKLQDAETLTIRMHPRIGTAKDEAGFSNVSKCCFTNKTNRNGTKRNDFEFSAGVVDIDRDMSAFVGTAFDKLCMRVQRMQLYFEGFLEVDVGKDQHHWLQDVIDTTAKAVARVDGQEVWGLDIQAVHGSSFCIRMPNGQMVPEQIKVEMVGGRGELVFDSIEVKRALIPEDHITTGPFTIKILNESHTLGNLLQGFIFDRYIDDDAFACTCVSYMKPYPLDNFVVLQLDAPGQTTRDTIAFLSAAAKSLREYIQAEKVKVVERVC